MGFLRWMRGGDDDASATSAMSAGLAEIDGLFRPSKHKQTEHVEESKRRRIDVANGADVDLDRNVIVVRSRASEDRRAREGGEAGGDRSAGRAIAIDDNQPTGSVATVRPRTVYQPRRRSLWFRLVRRIRRRRRARALAASIPQGEGTRD